MVLVVDWLFLLCCACRQCGQYFVENISINLILPQAISSTRASTTSSLLRATRTRTLSLRSSRRLRTWRLSSSSSRGWRLCTLSLCGHIISRHLGATGRRPGDSTVLCVYMTMSVYNIGCVHAHSGVIGVLIAPYTSTLKKRQAHVNNSPPPSRTHNVR